MMMSKPASEKEEECPAFATPAAVKTGTVEDLERRLNMLGSDKNKTNDGIGAADTAASTPTITAPSTSAPTVEAPTPAQAAPVVMKGGKNALLARIMAAKEKQERKAAAPPPAPAPDLLMDFDAPSTEKDPPPTYDTNFLKDAPPPPPPAFDVFEQQQQFPPPPPIGSVLPPPPPLNDVLPPPPMEDNFMAMSPSAPAATAPMFEDLHMQQQQQHHPPAMAPPMEALEQPAAVLDIDESILNALEPAEREAFVEEQRKILEQIEKEKVNIEASSAAARAMEFNQRSTTAVANVAASYESDGRANISSWRNESSATPTTTASNSTANMGAAAQLAADAELAEKLQKEEYAGAQSSRGRPRNTAQQQQQSQQSQSGQQSQSWYDWMTGAPTSAAPATRSSPTATASSSPSRGLVSAQTGEEARTYDESVMGIGGGGGGARTAEQKSMFSCVADSINTAATQMTAYNLGADEEGNVHGVDSHGLLALPDVSRQREE